jgi:tight adherence protein B
MEILITLGVFLFTLLLIHQGYFFIKKIYKPELKKVEQRLKTLSLYGGRNEAIDIGKKKILSEIPWLNRLLAKASFVPRLERLHSQAATSHPLGVFVILSVLLFVAGLLMGSVTRINLFTMVLSSVILATAPLVYLIRRRKKRMEKFERQLPEALELVSRALKAGHAFTGGLRMVAEEFEDPVGTEFGKTVDEINFGLAVPDALTNLTQRVDCEDLKFFAVSVIVQRESGGNLSEILEGLGRLMRERFKFQGRVRILSAEGRMSATVLVAMPFCVVGILSVLNPDYMHVLFSDPLGTYLIITALAMMSIGSYVIKKLVALKA